MKTVLLDEDEPPYIDESSRLLLRAARQAARRVGLGEKDFIVGKRNIQWFPWIGTRGLLTLSLLAESSGLAAETDQMSIVYHVDSQDQVEDHLRKVASAEPDEVSLARLMPVKRFEKFDEFVPEALLDEANAKTRLSITEASEAARTFCSPSVEGDSGTVSQV